MYALQPECGRRLCVVSDRVCQENTGDLVEKKGKGQEKRKASAGLKYKK